MYICFAFFYYLKYFGIMQGRYAMVLQLPHSKEYDGS